MTIRAIAAVIGGIVIWSALFMVIGIAFGLAWPDYRAAASQFFENDDFSLFTVPMMLTNFVLFSIAGALTGWLVSRLGGTRKAGAVLSVLMLIYGVVNHYIIVWDILPAWYNLVVPLFIAGPMFAASRMVTAGKSA